MARTKHGLPGIYNSSAITLSDGEGAALALDSSGRLVLGTSTASIGTVSGTVTANHGITGGADGVKTVTAAGTDEALAASTPCKKVDIQAQTDNTGLIAVGFTGVDATVATGTGILLNAGEVYSLEIDNLADIFIDSTVSGEGVRYTYYT